MIINYKYISININTDYFDRSKPVIIFLHGFSGSSEDWKEILPNINSSYSPIAIDLIGHGKSSCNKKENDYTVYEIINQLHFVLRYFKIKDPVICGYSMGGRAALSFTVNHPNIPGAIILESTTAGIENPEDKIARVTSDTELARNLLSVGMEWFTDHWMNIPLFESQKQLPKKTLEEIRKRKLEQNPLGLALSLRGFGTGKMPSLWNNLRTLRQKTLYITGELDSKFTDINRKMLRFTQNAEHKIIPNSGHNTHLEKPEEFTILVNNFLKSL